MCGGSNFPLRTNAGASNSAACNAGIAQTGGGQSHDHTLSANFSGSANSVLQPYLVLIYIIKT
jgi:hypothetical protein